MGSLNLVNTDKFRGGLCFIWGKFKGIFVHELFWIAVAGLFLRLVLLPYFSTFSDPYSWARGLIFFNNGYDPYAVHVSVYPPFIYLLYSHFFRFVDWLGFSGTYFSFIPQLEASIGTPAFLSLWKIPLICFDFLVGFLIYSIFKEVSRDVKMPRLAFLVWIFNPLNLVITYMHGAWDIVVGFFVLLGVFLIFKKNFVIGGLSFGLGALVKLSPVYLVIPFSLLILFQGIGGFTAFSVRKNFFGLFLFLLGFGLPFLVFAPLVLSYVGLTSYLPFSSSEGFIYNSINQWFFAVHPLGFEWINSQLDVIQKLPVLFVAVSAIFVLLLAKRGVFVSLSLNKILVFAGFLGVLSFIFYPSIIQPQYVLWYLPLLACLASIYRPFRLPFVVLSVADILYYFARQGIVTPLAPLASYSTIFNVELYQSSLAWYYSLPGVIAGPFRYDVVFLSGFLGFLALLIVLFRGAKLLWRHESY